MPRLNPHGLIADQRRDWYDDTRTVYQDCSTGVCRVVLSDGTELARHGANQVIAGGGVWAGWLAGYGVFGNTIGHLPEAGIHGTQAKAREVSPDGAVCYKPQFNSFGPWRVRELNGEEWTLTEGDCQSAVLLGGREAVWMDGLGRLHYHGAKSIRLPDHPVYGWSACVADGHVVVVYQNPQDEGSLVLDGHVIAPPSPFYFYPDVAFIDGWFYVTWSPNQADTDPKLIILTPEALVALPKAGEVALPPTPKPLPEPEPTPMPEIPAELQNQLALVTEVRNALYPNMVGQPLNNPAKAFQVTKGVAWRLKHLGIGLVKAKPGSDNNVEGYTNDIVALRDGHHWDVLIAGGEEAFPNWALEENPANNPPIAARWSEPIPPAGTDPDPDPPTDEPHTYDGGDNDTGTCDICGKPRADAIHTTNPDPPPSDIDPWVRDQLVAIRAILERHFR